MIHCALTASRQHDLVQGKSYEYCRACGLVPKLYSKLKRTKKTSSQLIKIQLLAVYDYKCFYCGCKLSAARVCMADELPATVDHYIPRSRGGGFGFENLRPACRPCNEAKGNMMPEEFLAIRLAWRSGL